MTIEIPMWLYYILCAIGWIVGAAVVVFVIYLAILGYVVLKYGGGGWRR